MCPIVFINITGSLPRLITCSLRDVETYKKYKETKTNTETNKQTHKQKREIATTIRGLSPFNNHHYSSIGTFHCFTSLPPILLSVPHLQRCCWYIVVQRVTAHRTTVLVWMRTKCSLFSQLCVPMPLCCVCSAVHVYVSMRERERE